MVYEKWHILRDLLNCINIEFRGGNVFINEKKYDKIQTIKSVIAQARDDFFEECTINYHSAEEKNVVPDKFEDLIYKLYIILDDNFLQNDSSETIAYKPINHNISTTSDSIIDKSIFYIFTTILQTKRHLSYKITLVTD